MKPVAVIPCLDISEGRVVKGIHFTGLQDAGDPAEAAAAYSRAGADMIAFLDIHATRESRKFRLETLRGVVAASSAPIIAGGGISSLEDARAVLEAGAAMALITTAGLMEPTLIETVSREFGRERVVVGIDGKERETGGYSAYYAGGSMDSGKDVVEWAKEAERLGAGMILLTSIDKDGARDGYDIPMTRAVSDAVNIPVVASGGAGELKDFSEVVLEGGASAVLAASLFHFGVLRIEQVKSYLEEQGIPAKRFSVKGDLDALRFDEKGLIPAITQDYLTGEVLMQAYMNKESLEKTLESGVATYFSRSRQKLWVKGETSGHFQYLRELCYDCDGDSLLLRVRQMGPACHTGERSCFHHTLAASAEGNHRANTVLMELYGVIADRDQHPKEGSYTNYLLEKGVEKICKKVGEESAEVIIAAMKDNAQELRYESADLLYHLLVLLYNSGVRPEEVLRELTNRR